jgi:mono/diheme cytochrome c family protein
MDELISKAAAAQGLPAEMVERAAKARAAAKGVSVEALLIEWGGGEAAAAGSTPAPTAAVADAPGGDAPAAAPPAPAADTGPRVEVLGPSTAADSEPDSDGEPDPAGEPEPAVEPEEEPEPVGVLAGFPRWLAIAFVVIPALAMFYALTAPDGPNCGTSGQLALDPVTGEAVNCDGTAYGVEVVNFFATGEEIFANRCAACHGAGGGGGAGPAMSGGSVLATFPAGQCAAHLEWVSLGTADFPEETYGVLAKPVGGGGVMPGFSEEVAGAAGLTPEDIVAVVLYERVAFGNEPLPDAELDCAPEGEEGETVTATS